MANRGTEEAYPLVQRSASRDSFVGLGPSSRISSVSDLSSPASPLPGLYDPHVRRSGSQDFVSPQHSNNNLYSRAGVQDTPAQDGIDISHVKISSPVDPLTEQQQHFNAAAGRFPDAPRTGPPPSPSAGSNPNRYSWQSPSQYASLSPVDNPAGGSRGIVGRLRSIRTSGRRRLSWHQPIPEEGDEMDVGLIRSSSGYGVGRTAYSTIDDINEDEPSLGVDISSFTGPMSPHDEATVLQYRRLESEGHLTGGLGLGLKPEERITSTDLFASVATSPIEVSRRSSRRDGALGRTATLKDLGQREANRRGKIIEVVVEAPAQHVDLSSFGGASTSNEEFEPNSQGLQRTVPLATIETYYPQANWKPLSMRWPYLTALTAISITLAAVQEYLYQTSNSKLQLIPKQGLYTFLTPEDITTWDYFSFKYLPTILAVVYGILWQFTDFEVKRLEAYYQLSKDGGALAAESINVDYVTLINFLRPFRAFRYKHWAVAVSSIATLFAVSLVPTLQAASVVLEPNYAQRLANPHGPKFVIIDNIWSRFLTTALGLISVMGCILLWQLTRRRSGLVADVKGIAGIAAMATKSHVLMDFKDLDTVPPKAIYDKLKNHRYTLRNSSLAPDKRVPVSRADKDKYDQHHFDDNPHPLMLRPIATVPFIVGMLIFLGLLPVVLWTSANIITQKAPWLLTALAVIIKICFQTLEQDVRLMEPFYRLSCRHAPPQILTLDYTGMAFGEMPIRAAINGDYLVALVGFGSVLAEVLTVCVTSFAGVTGADFLPGGPPPEDPTAHASPDSGEETVNSFWVSFGLSVTIMFYLIIVASVTLKLRRHPFLPRQPSTIASVLAFIHQSKMLYDFVGKDEDNEIMVQRLAEAGKTYGLGWFTGRDGHTHCGVDQEELRGGYKHKQGEDVRRATNPWHGTWEP